MARFDPRLVQYTPSPDAAVFTSCSPSACARRTGVQSAALTRESAARAEAFGRIAFVPDGFEMPRDRETFTSTMDTVDEGFFYDDGHRHSARPRLPGVRRR